MNTRTKGILAAAGLVLAGGVWVPQFLGGSDAHAPAIVEEAPADGGSSGYSYTSSADEGEPRSDSAYGDHGAAGAAGAMSEPAGEGGFDGASGVATEAAFDDPLDRIRAELETGGPSDVLASLDETIGLTESFGAGGGLQLDELIQAMRDVEAERGSSTTVERSSDPTGFQGESNATGVTESTGTYESPSLPVPIREDETLAEWAARNPITILVVSESSASAMLGHRVVRPGDRIERGEVLISEIGPGYVLLMREDEHFVHELPPFVALRKKPTTSDPVSSSTPSDETPDVSTPTDDGSSGGSGTGTTSE